MRLRSFEVKELAEESQVTNFETTGNSILDDKLGEKDVKDEEGAMPVPQVCLGPEGEIPPPKKKKNPTLVNYGSLRKMRRSGQWKREGCKI